MLHRLIILCYTCMLHRLMILCSTCMLHRLIILYSTCMLHRLIILYSTCMLHRFIILCYTCKLHWLIVYPHVHDPLVITFSLCLRKLCSCVVSIYLLLYFSIWQSWFTSTSLTTHWVKYLSFQSLLTRDWRPLSYAPTTLSRSMVRLYFICLFYENHAAESCGFSSQLLMTVANLKK